MFKFDFVMSEPIIKSGSQGMNNANWQEIVRQPPPKQKPKVEPTRIEVSAQGQISLDHVNVTAAELKTKLTALKAENPDLGVVVKGADDTDYQIMVGVLDTLRQLDITKMGMATE